MTARRIPDARLSSIGARRLGAPALATALLAAAPALAYERDVHFGLTRWLAVQAGFEPSQADAIAVANARVDGGLIDTQTLTPEFACIGRFAELAREVQQRHHPAARAVPAPAAERTVVAGGDAARSALAELYRQAAGKEGLMLGKLGEALHPLQDSWAHEGQPAVPASIGDVGCDAALVSGRPLARGGPDAHDADVTAKHADDTLAMARATYDALRAYPPIQGRARPAAEWRALAPRVQAFAHAASKTAKRAWFDEAGVSPTGFLQGISLPDGAEPGPLEWTLHKMPALPGAMSNQHDAPADARDFFDRLLARWLGPEPLDTVAAEAAGDAPDAKPGAGSRELAARMKLWKLHDHGAAAKLAHAPKPLDAQQLRHVDRLAQQPDAFLTVATLADAVYPLLAHGPMATPLLPYLLLDLPAQDGAPRIAALIRLRHAPYDTLVWIAARREGRWVLSAIQGMVEP